jgi:16S rRNA (guanine527-N7)-methyltransferase
VTCADPVVCLSEGLDRLGLAGQPSLEPRLIQYIEEIELWNPKLRITGASGVELVIKHILDSLSAVQLLRTLGVRKNGAIADLGSGGGLPGIPLSMVFPLWIFTLVERSGRRAGFLRNCKALLNLENVSIFEDQSSALDTVFDCVVFRAYRSMTDESAQESRTLVDRGGVVVAYKGRRDQAGQDAKIIGRYFPTVEVYPVEVPFLSEERHLIVARVQ